MAKYLLKAYTGPMRTNEKVATIMASNRSDAILYAVETAMEISAMSDQPVRTFDLYFAEDLTLVFTGEVS